MTSMNLPKITPVDDLRSGRMLAQGRLKATVTSLKSGQHITLSFRSKAKVDGEWKNAAWVEATHVFIEAGKFDRVATYYPMSGKFFPADNADEARVFAALEVLKWVSGNQHHPLVEIIESDHCGRCGRELTDPESIRDGIGPECYNKITGTSRHQKKNNLQGRLI